MYHYYNTIIYMPRGSESIPIKYIYHGGCNIKDTIRIPIGPIAQSYVLWMESGVDADGAI